MTDELNHDDEIVDVRLPRKDYETLRQVLERERTYGNITGFLKNSWVWVVAGGFLSLFLLKDYIKGALR